MDMSRIQSDGIILRINIKFGSHDYIPRDNAELCEGKDYKILYINSIQRTNFIKYELIKKKIN